MAQGVVRRAFDSGKVDFNLINPREFASNAYKTVDDRPYGGGPRYGDDGAAVGAGHSRGACSPN